ncbi:MAG: hypothetical protein GY705_05425 [Bacteroidetes bacterium]|nr:hypothetical protein [Bacteroidota bacterium]
MTSGYYKYIVFNYQLKEETGKVFNSTDFGSEIENLQLSLDLPNSYWIAQRHQCAPIWYGWENAQMDIGHLKEHLIG